MPPRYSLELQCVKRDNPVFFHGDACRTHTVRHVAHESHVSPRRSPEVAQICRGRLQHRDLFGLQKPAATFSLKRRSPPARDRQKGKQCETDRRGSSARETEGEAERDRQKGKLPHFHSFQGSFCAGNHQRPNKQLFFVFKEKNDG